MIESKFKTVLELYEGHPERWTQGVMARDSGGDRTCVLSEFATQWCLVGALRLVYGLTSKKYDPAWQKLKRVIGEDSYTAMFNDEHTFEEVLEVVRKAGV
jgi:hypothetical protein